MNLVINENPIKEEHICYYTSISFNHGVEELSLNEMVLATYRHPNAPEYAFISQIESRTKTVVKRTDRIAVAEIELLENIQNIVYKLHRCDLNE